MIKRPLIALACVFSVGLNLALAGLIAQQLRPPQAVGLAPRRIVELPTTPTAPAPMVDAPVQEKLSWRSLDSEDYRTLMARLREVECPEATIRNIVERDLARSYLRKRTELLQPYQQQFWQLACTNLDLVVKWAMPEVVAWEKQINAASKELGCQPITLRPDDVVSLVLERRRKTRESLVSFLPLEKVPLVEQLNQDFIARRDKLSADTINTNLTEQLQALQLEETTALGKVLTESELFEYQLRSSTTARRLRYQPGLQITESDYRRIVALEQERTATTPNWKPETDEGLRFILGPVRFTILNQGRKPELASVLRITDRLDLAPEVAMASWQARARAEEKAAAIRKDRQLNREERKTALEQLRAGAESEQRLVWGANEKVYFKYSGDWLDGLVK